MTLSFLDLLRSSFRCFGFLKEGQAPNADDITDATLICNSMLSAWGAKRLLVYAQQILTFPFVPGQKIYTLGPSGEWDTLTNGRPERIEEANLILSTTPVVRRPISVLKFPEWSRIKVQDISSSIPLAIYLDEAWPLGNLYTWPTASLAYSMELFVWGQLAQITGPAMLLNLPNAYADAIRYNLAIRLHAEWGGELRPQIPGLAKDSLASIESINAPTPKLHSDAKTGRHGGSNPTFNYLDGSGR